MLIVLLILGGLVGMVLGVVALSSFAPVSVEGLTTPHASRARRERRQAEPGVATRRVDRYPAVPPPLAPMSQTPKVLRGSGERVLPPPPPLFSTPAVPQAQPVVFAAPSIAPQPKPSEPPPRAPPPPPGAPTPTVTAFEPPAVSPPIPPPLPKPKGRAAAKLAAEAASSIADDPELVDLLRKGYVVAAVKRYRDRHGVGLEEAKAALDAWRAQSARREQVAKVVTDAASTAASDPAIVAAIRKGNIIEAIKLYRAKTGVSLQDAKEAVDEWRRNMGR